MKSFEITEPLESSLNGFRLANPTIGLIPEHKIFYRKDILQQKTTSEEGATAAAAKDKDHNYKTVALISGGGSGHEPTHAGFIGHGMLTAAVCGDIFASPSTGQILNAIKLVSGKASSSSSSSSSSDSRDVLLIVKNYTGDVLHFGLSAERARAIGIDCRVVVVGDDVAVGRKKGGMVGRRGLAGTVLVHKITGAFAKVWSHRYGLDGVAKVAEIVNSALVTIGSSLDHCKVPGRNFETTLGENQMEVGMGIHNEPGVTVLEPIPETTEKLISEYMLPKLLDPTDTDRAYVQFQPGDQMVLLVNNLGGVSNFIISGIAYKTVKLLREEYGIVPERVISGTLMTAFNGNGFSITLLNASQVNREMKAAGLTEVDSVFQLLNEPTDAPAWSPSFCIPGTGLDTISESTFMGSTLESTTTPESELKVKAVGSYDYTALCNWMRAAATQITKSEPHITELDTQVGDGDCGYTLVAGINGIVNELDHISKESLSLALAQLSHTVETSMGGTSGGLYSILISGFVQGLIETYESKQPDDPVTAAIVAESLVIALRTLYKYTNARRGSSTMIDALDPFVAEFAKSHDFKKAVRAAEEGAKSTASLSAKFGRASYVGDSSHVEDPGAVGLVEFLRGIESTF